MNVAWKNNRRVLKEKYLENRPCPILSPILQFFKRKKIEEKKRTRIVAEIE
jgi:hypothetical protein